MEHAPRAANANGILASLLILSCLLAYGNSFQGVFLFDDTENIVGNVSIRSFERLWNAEEKDIARGLHRRPLVSWSLALNYRVSKLEPWSYHVLNLAIHIAAALLLMGIVRRTLLLPSIPSALRERAAGFAFSVALLWAVHPLQTESVTYIVQRCESLMGMFFLATLYLVMRGSQSKHAAVWYVGAIVCCAVGMGTKEVMITAPLVVLLYDRAFLAKSWNEVVRRRGWVYAGFAPAALWLFLSASGSILPRATVAKADSPAASASAGPVTEQGKASAPKTPALYADRWSYLKSQPAVLLHYLRLCYVPLGQCLDYLWPVARDPLVIGITSAAILALVAASSWAWFRDPRLGFLGFSCFIILAPTSSIISLNLAFEHRMYLPLACVIILTLLAVDAACRRWFAMISPKSKLIAVGLIALSLMALTYARNQLYHSELSMWGDIMAKAPHNPRGYNGYGWGLLQQGRDAEAVPYFKQAIERMPHFWEAHKNLADAAQRLGHPRQMLEHAQIAYQLRPSASPVQGLLVRAVEANGDHAEAEKLAREFLEKNPSSPDVLHALGNVLLVQGRYPEACRNFERFAQVVPESAEAYYSLGVANHAMNETKQAEQYYQQALALAPNHAQAHNNLGRIHYDARRMDSALWHYQQAMLADRKLPHPHLNAGTLLLENQHFEAAILQFREALRLAPGLTEATEGIAQAERMLQAVKR